MQRRWLLYVRISKKQYNETLYNENTLYMNSQISFNNKELKAGQADVNEGVYTTIPSRLLYSIDEKETWHELGWTSKMAVNANAYIFCVYGVEFCAEFYDKSTNTYRYVIPWNVIKQFECDEDAEIMVILNTEELNQAFLSKAEELGMRGKIAPVKYDLEERQKDPQYIHEVMMDSFESVFHKYKQGYDEQKEVRFAVVCPDKPDYYKMKLKFENQLLTRRFAVVQGAYIVIDIHGLTFDEEGNVKNFSPQMELYYGYK